MNEDDLNRITQSFVCVTDECTDAIACLLTVTKYYGGRATPDDLKAWCDTGDAVVTLTGIKQGAARIGIDAEICLQNMEQLRERILPVILHFQNELGEMGYVVCYGLHEGRFIVWEPTFGMMQYYPEEMETMWVQGISMVFFPTPLFFSSLKSEELQWWKLFDRSKTWKKRFRRWAEYIRLSLMPRLRF